MRASHSRKAQQRQTQLEEAKRFARELVELLDRRGDPRDVHYLTIERERVGAVYTDASGGPLFKYRERP
jgi:hypothetical protein